MKRLKLLKEKFASVVPVKFHKRLLTVTLLLSVVILHVALITKDIQAPFTGYNEDNNALYSIAANNIAEEGLFKLKLGMVTNKIIEGREITFYTHHPSFFIFPTALSYKLFGVSEATTRLAPIIFSIMSVVLMFLLVLEARKKLLLAFISAFVLATFPTMIQYGKMLDPEIFVIFFSLLSFYLFYLRKRVDNKYLDYALLISIFLGLTMGWHFYFSAFIVWVAILLEKDYPRKKFFTFAIPGAVILAVTLLIGQFLVLGGKEAVDGLLESGASRSSGIPFESWKYRMIQSTQMNYSAVAAFVGIVWAVFVVSLTVKSRKIGLRMLLLAPPLLVMIAFRQWMTHFYGVMYFAPFFALVVAETINISFQIFKKISSSVIIGAVMLIFMLAGQYYLSSEGYRFFRSNVSFDAETMDALQLIKDDRAPEEICYGADGAGRVVNAIYGYYLDARVVSFDRCMDDDLLQYAIISHPNTGSFEMQIMNAFVEKGYAMVGCGGQVCLLELEVEDEGTISDLSEDKKNNE